MWWIETISLLIRRSRCSYRSICCTPCLVNPVIPRLSTHFVRSAGGRVLSTHPSFSSLCVTSPLGLSVGLRLGFITPLPRRCLRHNKCKYVQWFPRLTPRVKYRRFPCLRISFHTLWYVDVNPLYFLLFFLWVWNLVADIAGGKEAEGVWEHGVEENIWT